MIYPQNNLLEANVPAKSGDCASVEVSNRSVGNPKVGAQHSNQPLDNEARQLLKMIMEAGRKMSSRSKGGGKQRRRGGRQKGKKAKRQKKNMHTLCVRRKEAGTMPPVARGAASPWLIGRAQKPASGEVSLTTG
jgi:hypothetical protein